MPESIYVMDSSVLIDFSRQLPRDIFEGVWEHLTNYVRHGRVLIHRMVVFELTQKSDKEDDAALWTKSIPDDQIVELDDIQGAFIHQMGIDDDEYGRRLAMPEYMYSADPFVIALGKIRSCCVVTNERSGKGKIPEICARYSIDAMKAHDMMRAENWTF